MHLILLLAMLAKHQPIPPPRPCKIAHSKTSGIIIDERGVHHAYHLAANEVAPNIPECPR